jgi:putative ATP-binding cassette transporter
MQTDTGGKKASLSQVFQEFWSLAQPYWSSEQRWSALTLLAAVIALTFGSVSLAVKFNEFNRTFFDVLQKLQSDRIFPLLGQFALIITGTMLVEVYKVYLTQLLQIRWRHWMTERMLGRWLTDRTFYFMQLSEYAVENPDQRVAEDIRAFVNESLSLSVGLLNKVVTLLSFLAILWKLSGNRPFPGYLPAGALLYAVFGTVITHFVGRSLTRLNFEQQRHEADFRFGLVRVRENAESIALSRGGEAEQAHLMGHFSAIVANFRKLMTRQKRLGFFRNMFNNSAQFIPMALASPLLFSKAIEIGGFFQIINAFGNVENALAWIVNSYVDLTHWRSVVQRLHGFAESMTRAETLRASARGTYTPSADVTGGISVNALSLRLPSQEPLLTELSFVLPRGRYILLHGPSGCGKSTLIRALSGAWPYATGNVRVPSESRTLVLPQKPFMPVDTLRAALTYPSRPEEFTGEELPALLSLCRLEHLIPRLGQVANWAQILSPGEQQRIAFVRAFLHQPEWLFLDEATSALDEATQTSLYRAIGERLPGTTVVSIAHRTSLHALHDLHFDVVNGRWSKAAA